MLHRQPELHKHPMSLTVFPPEWDDHLSTWTAWPAALEEWPKGLTPVRAEVASMVRALSEGERVKVLVSGDEAFQSATKAIGDVAEILSLPYNDIWLRDTGPIFCRSKISGKKIAQLFRFNGWGGKYNLPQDEQLACVIAKQSKTEVHQNNFILEGGSIDTDGQGTILTTRQCLLNKNRNQQWDQKAAEYALLVALGVENIVWLDDGLLNDHTDGHVDNIARFVSNNVVLCQRPSGTDDPNAETLQRIEATLRRARNALGEALEVRTIPSPGLVYSDENIVMPASHMNFYIGNRTVVVPIYNQYGESAVKALSAIFPTREVIGLSSRAILEGGGSFHCITQQEPV